VVAACPSSLGNQPGERGNISEPGINLIAGRRSQTLVIRLVPGIDTLCRTPR